jgi:hypothetical protein
MSNYQKHFNIWFKDIIESQYNTSNAGFVILMITFPLLERFIRSKRKIPYKQALEEKSSFFEELTIMFPALKENKRAKEFWTVYRHGILHQATFSVQDNKKNILPNGWLSGDTDAVEFHSDDSFWVNPAKFAQIVINAIEEEPQYFEALNSSTGLSPLASAQTNSDGFYGTTSPFKISSLNSERQPITYELDDNNDNGIKISYDREKKFNK